jgi:hypothetical protein
MGIARALARGLLAAGVLLSGCMAIHHTERSPGQSPPTTNPASAPNPAPTMTPPNPSPSPPQSAGSVTEPTASAVERVPTNPSASPTSGNTRSRQQTAQSPVEPSASHPQAPSAKPAPAAATPTAPSRPAASAAASLDLAALEQRLRDTKAIGVLTKLTLKNQVDDLLNHFRLYHEGRSDVKLEQLRQSYDLLLLKVLSLLQDKDVPLASAISASREAIWAILIDPRKFAALG